MRPFRQPDGDESAFLLPAGAPWLLDDGDPFQTYEFVTSPRRKRRKRKIALALLGTILLGCGGVVGYGYWQTQSLLGELHAGGKGVVVDAARQALGTAPPVALESRIADQASVIVQPAPAIEKHALANAQTILLVGSDARWGERGGRSDTMMLLRILPAKHELSLLSIPRDLKVPIPGYGENKVNAAFAYGGEKLLIETLRNYLGVRIDHFVEVNFRGFSQIINSLGGVYLPVDQRYYNHNVHTAATNYADIDLQPGYQRLNATDTLSYVRYRHGDSDFSRAARQQLFMRETERQVIAAKFDFLRMSSLIHAFAKATASDISSIGEVWQLAEALRTTPADRAVRLTVPAQGAMIGGISYEIADRALKDRTVVRWYHPEWTVQKQASATQTVVSQQRRIIPTARTNDLVSDGGRASALLRQLPRQFARCVPTMLPHGYFYPSSSAARAYTLAGHPAIAFYSTAGSGRSLLWMETTWADPPILARPTRSISVSGRSFDVWEESGTLRQVAFRIGDTQVWLQNTLLGDLPPRDMLALAASCR